MDILRYREQRQKLLNQVPDRRNLCHVCLQPEFGCYCSQIQKFDAHIKFAILIHPIEVRRRIATGRMSHLCLVDSELIVGHDYSNNQRINSLVSDERYHCVMLYPGPQSENLSRINAQQRLCLFPRNKKLLIFVIDGTWATAKKMVKHSQNLHCLPRICFSPEKPSNFQVRKQPRPECYSTIEAIHQTIDLVGDSQGFTTKNRQHDALLHVFDYMVQRQLKFIFSNVSGHRGA